MHTCALTQTTPWCFLFRLSLARDLPVCKKNPSTSALMTRKKDGSSHIVFHTAALSCASSRHSILRLRRGPFGLTGRRLNGQARRLFGLDQTRKSLCGTSVSKGLLVSYITPIVPKHATYLPEKTLPLPRIVILSGRKHSMCENPQPEQVGTKPKDLMPHI